MGRRSGCRWFAWTRPRGRFLPGNGVARSRAALHTSSARRERPFAYAELGNRRTRRFRTRAERLAVLRALAEARQPDGPHGRGGGATAVSSYGTEHDPG